MQIIVPDRSYHLLELGVLWYTAPGLRQSLRNHLPTTSIITLTIDVNEDDSYVIDINAEHTTRMWWILMPHVNKVELSTNPLPRRSQVHSSTWVYKNLTPPGRDLWKQFCEEDIGSCIHYTQDDAADINVLASTLHLVQIDLLRIPNKPIINIL